MSGSERTKEGKGELIISFSHSAGIGDSQRTEIIALREGVELFLLFLMLITS